MPGGATEVVASGVLDGASRAFALHCDPSVPAGKIGLRTGAITAACDRIDVTLIGPGGHTARPQLTVDLVDALGRLITDVPGAAVAAGRPARRDVAGLGRGQRRHRGQRHPAARSAARHGAGARPRRLEGRRGADALAGRADRRHHGRRGRRRLRARRAAGGQRPPRGGADAGRGAGDRRQRPAWCCPPQSMGGEDFGWFADVMPIALARLGTHGGGPPLDLHRGTFDVDERAIGIGVRLLARTALHALEADAAPARQRAGPRPETLLPDASQPRSRQPTMSPPDQQTGPDAPAGTDAEVPAEHEVPDELTLAGEFDAVTRDQWRDLVAGVLRKAGREDLPDPVEDALRVPVATGVSVAPLYTAEDAGDLPRRSACPGVPPFVRGAPGGRASGERDARGVGHPPAARAPRRRDDEGGDRRRPRERRHLAVAGARRGRDPGRLARRRAGRRAPRPRAGRRCPAGMPAAEAFLVAGRGPHGPGARRLARARPARAARGQRAAQDLSGLADVARRAAAHDGLRTVVVDAHRLRRRRGVGGRGARLLARGRGRLPAGAHRGRAVGRRGVRPAGVPLQRERRPVHDDRRAARRPPAVGPRRRGQRGLARGPRAAPARRHLLGDDDEARPVGQPAADDGGLLRRGRGRRRRGDRAAVRRGARPARLVLPADRPQHPEPAGRGGAPGPRPRPGRRLLVRRVADRVAGAGGVGLVHRDRAGRRPGRGAGLRSGARPDRRRLGRPVAAAGHPGRRDHRRQRVPQPGREAARPAARGRPAAVRRAAPGARRAGVRGAARRADAAELARGLPGHDRPDRPAHRPGHVRRQPLPGRRARDAVRRRRLRVRRRRTRRSPASAAPTRTTRSPRPGWPTELREAGATHGVAGRQARPRGRRRRRVRVRRVRRPRRAAHRARAAGSARHERDPRLRVGRAGPPVGAAPRSDDWAKAFEETTGRGVEEATWETPEGIAVPPLFTPDDLRGLDFLDTYPGIAAVPARALPDDVHDPAVDGPAVRRLLHRRRSPTRSTGATSPPGRRGCRSPSTCPRTAATTPTTRGCSATSAWPGWRSTRSWTCGSCSTASRWTR